VKHRAEARWAPLQAAERGAPHPPARGHDTTKADGDSAREQSDCRDDEQRHHCDERCCDEHTSGSESRGCDGHRVALQSVAKAYRLGVRETRRQARVVAREVVLYCGKETALVVSEHVAGKGQDDAPVRTPSHGTFVDLAVIGAQNVEGSGQDPRDVHLTDSNEVRDLSLCESAEEP
jgi:hypothetical protein